MNNLWYKLFDPNPSLGGACEIDRSEAAFWNQKNYGIFWSVNSFRGARRKTNLHRILAWALDLDQGTKQEQMRLICAGLIPSLIVETRKGYHVYFLAKDATIEGYRSILLDRLCYFYGSDVRATDLCRILRVPGYYHCKNPDDRFLVKRIHRYPVSYTEREICWFYPPSLEAIERDRKREEFKEQFSKDTNSQSGDLWQKVWDFDCENALIRLSGHAAVGGEIFSFKQQASGNLNIYVNGKGTSCWIDREKRIGSLSGGGPTLYQWVNFYHRNPKKTVLFMREIFPELWSMNL